MPRLHSQDGEGGGGRRREEEGGGGRGWGCRSIAGVIGDVCNVHVSIRLLFVDALCEHDYSDRDEFAVLECSREYTEECLLQRNLHQKLVTEQWGKMEKRKKGEEKRGRR